MKIEPTRNNPTARKGSDAALECSPVRADDLPLKRRPIAVDSAEWLARREAADPDLTDKGPNGMVRDHLLRLRAEAQAKAIFNREATDRAAERDSIPILTRSQLNDIGKYNPLIEDALVDNDLNFTWGPSGSLKSFFKLDQGLHIAGGLAEWHGHKIHRSGTVIYVMGEGASGALRRIEAWESEHPGIDTSAFRVVPQAVNLFSTRPSQTELLLRGLARRAIEPVYIVFDTQARCTAGANESSPGDMNIVVDNLQRIINETGAAVDLLHHSVKDGNTERGTESIRNAAALVMRASTNSNRSAATLKAEKLKEEDLNEAVPIVLNPHKVILGVDEFQREVSSLVLRSIDASSEPLRGKVLNAFQDAKLKDGTLTLSANVLAKACGGKRAATLDKLKTLAMGESAILVLTSGGYELAPKLVDWGLE